MSRKSASIDTLGEVGYTYCVVCLYCKKNYLIREIGNNWSYCKAYISQCLGEDETKKLEEEKIIWLNVPRSTSRETTGISSRECVDTRNNSQITTLIQC